MMMVIMVLMIMILMILMIMTMMMTTTTAEIPEASVVPCTMPEGSGSQPLSQQQQPPLPEAAMAYHVVDDRSDLPYPYHPQIIIIPDRRGGGRIFPDPSLGPGGGGGVIIADMDNPGSFFYVNEQIPPGEHDVRVVVVVVVVVVVSV